MLARALQDYGAYVVDRGGNGLTILAELGNTEIRWDQQGTAPPDWKDLQIIGDHLAWLDNNTEANRGGGGDAAAAAGTADQRGRSVTIRG